MRAGGPPNLELSPEQVIKAQEWLGSQWTTRACPFHGPTKWQVGRRLAAPVNYVPGGGVFLGGPAYPLIVVTCTACGFTVFVNAVVAGLIEPRTPPVSTESKEP
jgi:hypothetical protein